MTRRDIIEAIEELEQEPVTYAKIEKLAHLYEVYNNQYQEQQQPSVYYGRSEPEPQKAKITTDRSSEFLAIINGMDQAQVLDVLNELMDVLNVTNHRLYEGVLRKLQE